MDGAESVWVEGTTIRELLHNLGREHPVMRDRTGRDVAIAIDGVIFRDDWDQPIPEGAEICLLSRIAGG